MNIFRRIIYSFRVSVGRWHYRRYLHYEGIISYQQKKWSECLDYCKNDVKATKKAYHNIIRHYKKEGMNHK